MNTILSHLIICSLWKNNIFYRTSLKFKNDLETCGIYFNQLHCNVNRLNLYILVQV